MPHLRSRPLFVLATLALVGCTLEEHIHHDCAADGADTGAGGSGGAVTDDVTSGAGAAGQGGAGSEGGAGGAGGAGGQAPAAQPASCAAILAADPSASSGVYLVDPAGDGDAFEVHCEMGLAGGGWTLVANRTRNTVTGHAQGLLAPGDDALAIAPERWQELRSVATEALASFDGQTLVASLPAMAAANCTPLADDVADACIAHVEASSCDATGMDYSLWFCGHDLDQNTHFQDSYGGSFFGGPTNVYYWPTKAAMYVR